MEVKVIKPAGIKKEKTRAAVYARVSTDHEEQENSLKNQITHYEEEIGEDQNYELIEIYYDFGISGFKENRPGFQKMMKDARTHNFDLIITKSITRFARNTDTILKATRELKELGIGVFFELQNINTLTQAGEVLMTLYAAFAQGESDEASKGARVTFKRKVEEGIAIQYLERSFGYTKDENGVIVPDENAIWVKRIFELAAQGYNLSEIGRYMNDQHVKTKQGSTWEPDRVKAILDNVIYKGDFINQKCFIDDKRRLAINHGERKRWYFENDHVPIISHELWDRVRKERAKKREYLDTGSFVAEMNEMNYPYKNKLFCAKCGRPLYAKFYSNGNRLSWCCSGAMRYTKEFCEGVNVPDSIVRSWDPKENIYVFTKTDELGKRSFHYKNEHTFMHECHGKPKNSPRMPEQNKENYPYRKYLHCKYCGAKLTRTRHGHGQVYWICGNYKHHGKVFCKGIGELPNEKLKALGSLEHDIYIGKEIIDGKESYGYSSRPDNIKKYSSKNFG